MTNPFRALFGRAAEAPITLDPARVGEDDWADARALDASFATPAAFDGETLGRFWDAFLDAPADAPADDRDRRADRFADRLLEHVGTANHLDRLTELLVHVQQRMDGLDAPVRSAGLGVALGRRAEDVAAAFARLTVTERALGLGQEGGAACETAATTLAHLAFHADGPTVYTALAEPLGDYLARTPGFSVWPWGVFTFTPGWQTRLVAVVDHVLQEPDSGGREQVLSYARQMLYSQPPEPTGALEDALARAAARWPDDAFDAFLRGAVLPYGAADEAARAEALRSEPARRAAVDALHALGRTTPGAEALAHLHAAAHASAPDAASTAAPDAALPESDGDLLEMLDRPDLPAAFRDGRFAWVELQDGMGDLPALRLLDATDAPGEALVVVAEADDVRTLTEAALAWTDTALSDDERESVYEDLDPDDLADRALCRTRAAQRLWDRLTLFGAFGFEPADALGADNLYLAQLAAHADVMTPLFGFTAAPPYQDDAFAVVRLHG